MSDQFPKDCSCCGVTHDAQSWAALQLVGRAPAYDDADLLDLELRNCACKSTIAIEVPKKTKGAP